MHELQFLMKESQLPKTQYTFKDTITMWTMIQLP